MQEMAILLDAGFVVEWQLADESSVLIDLSTAESEVLLPEPVTTETGISG